jgi:hypothetical protein
MPGRSREHVKRLEALWEEIGTTSKREFGDPPEEQGHHLRMRQRFQAIWETR